jgi:hypothetical protein
MAKRAYLLSAYLILTLGLGTLGPAPATAQGTSRTFPETGRAVKGRFLEYWNGNGGLAQQGFPISDEMQERSDTDGKTYTVQYFERAVFELHPQNQKPFDVLLSLLGNFNYKQKYPNGAPNQKASTINARKFAETGKTLGGRFREYWEQNGGLAQQGFPISDEFQERSDLDGKTYTVQYFERAVFEMHPENKAPFDVLLSQLGTFRHRAKYTAGGTTPTTPPASKPGWAQITASNGGPSPRYDHSALYDPVRDRLVVFGGRGSGAFGDTWVFSFASKSWSEVGGTGPAPRFGQGTVYDPANRRMLVVMGEGAGFFNDVWSFDLDKDVWTQIKGNNTGRTMEGTPRPRYGQSAILDNRGRVVVSHGFSDQGRFDDTWAFDFARGEWVNITPTSGPKPLKRCLHEMAYNPTNDQMYLFGGCSSGFGPCPQGDLWVLDFKTGKWSELAPSGAKPTPRSNPTIAYDPGKAELYLFGGRTGNGMSAEAWSYSPARNAWTKVEGTGPAARASHATALDPQNKRLIIFGGQTASGPDADIWEWRY